MKNPIKIFAVILVSLSMIACGDERKNEEAFEDYKEYVEERANSAEQYYDREWSEIEQEYRERQQKAEARMDKWNDKTRAEYESLKMRWETFHDNYLAERDRKEFETRTGVLLTSLLPEGINPDMSNVTTSNILQVHKHFVDNVEAQKDNLSKEQWREVELLWERLDTRKDQLDKNLDGDVKLAIAEEKISYGAIKALNRPVAKSEEKEAKEEYNK